MLQELTISFIGAGQMGEAMIAGLLKRQLVQPHNIIATAPRAERRQDLRTRYEIQTTDDNRAAAHEANIVVFALKPQTLPKVLPMLKGALKPGNLVLSIVGGVPIATLHDMLDFGTVVRAMPNTPAQIAEGTTVWTGTESVTAVQHEQVRTILGALGHEHFVADEKYLDMATALSGTGPAYCFLVLEAMVDAGVHLGFPRRLSEDLVLQTMLGSTLFAMQSGKHLAELRNMVTSPAGTTAEALRALERGGLRTVLADGIWAAYDRAKDLGR
ncbi:MAG: pyrroline-5-carboxylate reductase [Herpetosiphon sp.]